ncbi:MAG TPA: asparagine synthase-related protein [Agriterribacter sp.]|nr:hypothetical protein [Chitinophagaceae bacterium]HRP31778.1 asparagine synthase-related protein [Agriterribacter sp.]
MPGIFGLTKRNKHNFSPQIVLNALNIYTDPILHRRQDIENNAISCSIVTYDFMQNRQVHFQQDEIELWVYGDPLIDGYTGEKAIELTAKLASQSAPDFTKIADIDGLFTIVILNKITNKLHIIGDRNGLSHIYYGIFNGQLIWASELRALISKQIKTTSRRESFQAFLALGYLVDNTTWYNEINLLPPASYLEWDLTNNELKTVGTYWSHKNLIKSSISKNENEIVKDIAELFANAVKRRVGENERIGITLSGGQDSRAIFANIPPKNGFTAITRGLKGCGDIKLATEVTRRRNNCTHVIHEVNETNWLTDRVNAVIATSGQKDFFNMNSMLSLPIHKRYFDINLDGSEGALLKGQCLNLNIPKDLKTFENYYLRNGFFEYSDTLEELLRYYKQIDSSQYFFLHENIRRFSVFGSILGHDYGIISRFPILDHHLQEYIYQLPNTTNIGKIWNLMLIKYFPEYFVKIDNLDTGRRLFKSDRLNYLSRILASVQSKVGIEKYVLKYHNYSNWMKNHDGGLIEKYLLPEQLNLYNYLDEKPIKNIIGHFLKTGEHLRLISRILGLSIFLEAEKCD